MQFTCQQAAFEAIAFILSRVRSIQLAGRLRTDCNNCLCRECERHKICDATNRNEYKAAQPFALSIVDLSVLWLSSFIANKTQTLIRIAK